MNLVDRVDPPGLVDRVDPPDPADRVGPPDLVDRADPPGLVDRLRLRGRMDPRAPGDLRSRRRRVDPPDPLGPRAPLDPAGLRPGRAGPLDLVGRLDRRRDPQVPLDLAGRADPQVPPDPQIPADPRHRSSDRARPSCSPRIRRERAGDKCRPRWGRASRRSFYRLKPRPPTARSFRPGCRAARPGSCRIRSLRYAECPGRYPPRPVSRPSDSGGSVHPPLRPARRRPVAAGGSEETEPETCTRAAVSSRRLPSRKRDGTARRWRRRLVELIVTRMTAALAKAQPDGAGGGQIRRRAAHGRRTLPGPTPRPSRSPPPPRR
jgi:hypothetical protein